VHFDVIIKKGGKEIPVQTLNLSLRGLRCAPLPELIPGSPCEVVILLDAGIRVHINGHIVRSTPSDAGIHFESMEENDFFHLKKIVQYNTQDPDKIDHELIAFEDDTETSG
jgi:hypothetical protein